MVLTRDRLMPQSSMIWLHPQNHHQVHRLRRLAVKEAGEGGVIHHLHQRDRMLQGLPAQAIRVVLLIHTSMRRKLCGLSNTNISRSPTFRNLHQMRGRSGTQCSTWFASWLRVMRNLFSSGLKSVLTQKCLNP